MSTPQQPGGKGPAGRPGAMTMAMQAVQVRPSGPKVLRIGVIQGGKIVEERIVRQRETVTVGSSERNHFIVPGMPPRFELFQLVGADYILNFTADMRGRVGLPGGVQELEQLRASGAARNAGTHWQVKLSDTSRGKVVIGDTTLLFQFVVPPPVQPRPQLPAAVVGGFIAGIDWLFTAFVMFSFMSHFGFIIFLENADWPIQPTLATIDDRVADMIFNEPEPPPEPQEEVPTEEAPTEEAEEVAETTPQPRGESSSAPSETPGQRQERADSEARMAVEEATAQVDQLLLGALSSEGGAFADVLAGGAVTGSAEDILAQAEGVGVATSSGGGTLRERSGGGRVGGGQDGLGGLAAVKGGATEARSEGGAVQERQVRGRFRAPADAEDESGSGDFDVRAVTAMIRTRQSAIRACYERELRNDPTLAGRIKVQLTIQESGSVTGVRAIENTMGNDAVAECVTRVVGGFRFNPGPDGGSVTYAFPFIFDPQN